MSRTDLDPGRLGLGDGAELLHHAERVKARPALGDLVVRDPVDRDPGDLHRLARRRHAHQLAILRAGGSPARDNAVAVGHLLLHDETAVREGGVVHRGGALDTRGAPCLAEGVLRVVVYGVGRDDLVECVEVAGVPRVVEPLGHGLVLLRHLISFGCRTSARTNTWRPACDRELAPLPGGAIPRSTDGPTRRSLYARRYASFRSAAESASDLVANCGNLRSCGAKPSSL